jgi:TetR/AcrR family transcriptional repressor of nem operon
MMVIMRYAEGHKEAVRARIVAAAAKSLREHGLSGVSVPKLMKSAGLTHGGFYAHFESRDDLVAAAVEAAGAQTAAGALSDANSLEETLGLYLSEAHLERPGSGCVVAALGAEGARHAPSVRRAFEHVVKGLLGSVERKLHPKRRASKVSDEALRLAATMVGAVVLGRLVEDHALAERILGAARGSAPI